MPRSPFKTWLIAFVFAAGIFLLYFSQRGALTDLRNENQNLKAELQKAQAEPPPPAPVAAPPTEIEQLRKDAAEVHRLRGQVAELTRERATTPAARPATKMTSMAANASASNNPMERQQLGDKLMAEGKFPEALEQFLWCYDEGAKVSPSFVGVRSSFLLMKLKDLASRYPPAQEALVARRDAAEAAVQGASASDLMKSLDVIRLNESLGESARNLALFDRLPVGHPARAQIVDLAMDQFIQANRFQDIVSSGSPEASLDRTIQIANFPRTGAAADESITAMQRRKAVETGGRGIQALAAVGKTERANAMMDKILKFDQSPETRGELLKYAERSGNAQVIAHLKIN